MNLLKPMYRTLLALIVVALPTLSGCSTNPVTGRSQMAFYSWDDEVQLGSEAAPQFLDQGGGELPDVEVVAYVRSLGSRLAASANQVTPDPSRPALEWEFHVLDSSVINAFALPGGKVFVSRGLMERMQNEAQLAGVIGHEIGHVTARHGNERLTQALGLQVLVAAIAVGSSVAESEVGQYIGIGTAAGGQLFLLSYGRDAELEADALGVHYMSATGYNPAGQIQVMEILRDAGGGGGTPEWLSTHPAPDTRITALEELITQNYPGYDDPSRYNWGIQSYQQNILVPLSRLPAPKHGQSAFIGPNDIERVAGITWDEAIHRGCECHTKAIEN